MSPQDGLWPDEPEQPHPFVAGEVRRALDRDIKTARTAGREFLETDLAAVRRQANDLDRLERIMQAGGGVKTWDYNPKTTAHQAYSDAIRRLFGERHDDDDPFVHAVAELERLAAAQAGAAPPLDAQGPVTTD